MIYRLAFDLKPVLLARPLELIIDVFILVDIILNFFTADLKDAKIEGKFVKIVKNYLKSYFLPDTLSCIPGLIIGEHYENKRNKFAYFLKILRYIQIHKLFF